MSTLVLVAARLRTVLKMPHLVGKKSTLQFEVAVKVRLKVEALLLILKPQPTIFFGG